MKGKLIVIEGLDGCGKATQAELLKNRLEQAGKSVKYISFPDYQSRSSSLAQMYLNGEFGGDPQDVNAYAASSFFAVDRYASFVTGWRRDYENGAFIVANRYTTANAPHQMSKLGTDEWPVFLDWLFDFEYNKLGLPKPDLVIQLSMPTEVSHRLLVGRCDGDEQKLDIHERAAAYMEKCRECAQFAAERHGWRVIPCAANGEPRPIASISDAIWEIIERSCLLVT